MARKCWICASFGCLRSNCIFVKENNTLTQLSGPWKLCAENKPSCFECEKLLKAERVEGEFIQWYKPSKEAPQKHEKDDWIYDPNSLVSFLLLPHRRSQGLPLAIPRRCPSPLIVPRGVSLTALMPRHTEAPRGRDR